MKPFNQLTKGSLVSIDHSSNTCEVAIPLLSPAGDDPVVITATLAIPPGIYNGYKAGDVVFVLFEDGWISTPVVIGKLYLGIGEEDKNFGGAIVGNQLYIANDASIPLTTKLISDADNNTAQTTSQSNNFKTIAELAETVQRLNSEIERNNALAPATIFCKDAVHNLYGGGPANHSYESIVATESVSIAGVQKSMTVCTIAIRVTEDKIRTDLSDAEMKQYMLYMIGYECLPTSDEPGDIYAGSMHWSNGDVYFPRKCKVGTESQLKLIKL